MLRVPCALAGLSLLEGLHFSVGLVYQGSDILSAFLMELVGN